MEEIRFCANCGAKVEEGAKFCAVCGASTAKVEAPVAQAPVAEPAVTTVAAPAEPVVAPVAAPVAAPAEPVVAPVAAPVAAPAEPVVAPVAAPVAPVFCANCGTPAVAGQAFCANCGAPTPAPAVNQPQPEAPASKKSPLVPILIAAGAVTMTIIIAICVWLALPRVKNVYVDTTSIELSVDDTYYLSGSVSPSDAVNGDITWRSTNESVATVNRSGAVTARGEGTCRIIASAGGHSASVSVTVTDGPNFAELFDRIGGDSVIGAELGADGSYIEIDTNRYDLDDYSNYTTMKKVKELNEELGLPDSVWTKMLNTRSIDGRQTHQGDGFTVSWTYHPDKGLEVLYSLD